MTTIDFINRSATQAAQDINENFSQCGSGGGSVTDIQPNGLTASSDKLVMWFDVVSTSAITKFFRTNKTTFTTKFSKVVIDGIEVSASELGEEASGNTWTGYVFAEKGLHKVELTLAIGQSIGQWNMYGLNRLVRLTLPDTATTANMINAGSVFRVIEFDSETTALSASMIVFNDGVSTIEHIIMRSETPPTFAQIYSGTVTNYWQPKIHVPKGCAAAYKTAWSTWANLITEEPFSEKIDLYQQSTSFRISNSPLAGKRIAFLGDSFTSDNYHKTSPTWPHVMCNIVDALMEANMAGGSQGWAVEANGNTAYQQAVNLFNTGAQPDYILAFMGVNDRSIPLGNITYDTVAVDSTTHQASEDGTVTFTACVQAALQYMVVNFPKSRIKIGWTPAGTMYLVNSTNNSSVNAAAFADINAKVERLKELAALYGVDYVETRNCQIDGFTDNFSEYTSSKHPNGAGHVRIGEFMAKTMMCNL